MSGETSESIISVDRPIEKPADDILGRNNFAVSIAKMISEWKGKESLVIGLYGPWGCGKTSIKNLIVHELKNTESAFCLEFNPWMWSGKKQLTETFFTEISCQIFGDKDKSKSFKKLALKFKVLRALTPSYEEAKQIIPIGSSVLASIMGTFIGRWFEEQVVISVIFALIVGSSLLFILNLVLKKIIQYYIIMAEYSSKSISERKADISSDLRKISKPVVVVIDDIDRLLDDEIAMMFQIVKCNADFDDMVYILLFDDNIVSRALCKEHVDGVNYLEKIVQMPLSVPAISIFEVERIFIEGINRILSHSKELSKNHDDEKWSVLYYPRIKEYLKNLRDVKRFLVSFEFHVGLFSKTEKFEVNPDDLIAVEIIRIFEPEVYKIIIQNKSILVNDLMPNLFADQSVKRSARLESFVNKVGDSANCKVVSSIVKQLFPRLSNIDTDSTETFKKCMVCNEFHFDKYFSFAISDALLSQKEIADLIDTSSNVNNFCGMCNNLISRGKESILMIAIEAYADSVDTSSSVPFVTSMCTIADGYKSDGLVNFGFSSNLYRAVLKHLSLYDKYEDRINITIQALRGSKSLLIVSKLLEHERAVASGRVMEPHIFDDAGRMMIAKAYTEVFEHVIKITPNVVFKIPEFRSIAWSYSIINGKKELKHLLKQYINTHLFMMLDALKNTRRVSDSLDYKITFSDIEEFIDIDTLKDALGMVKIDSLEGDEKILFDQASKLMSKNLYSDSIHLTPPSPAG